MTQVREHGLAASDTQDDATKTGPCIPAFNNQVSAQDLLVKVWQFIQEAPGSRLLMTLGLPVIERSLGKEVQYWEQTAIVGYAGWLAARGACRSGARRG